MSEQNTKAELTAKLDAKRAELAEINAKLTQVADMEKTLHERKRALTDGFNRRGEITEAELALRDCVFPVFQRGHYEWQVTRIISVDDTWVTLRSDKCSDGKRYKRDTGRRERCRSDYDKIDIAKAVEIWTAHQAEHAK